MCYLISCSLPRNISAPPVSPCDPDQQNPSGPPASASAIWMVEQVFSKAPKHKTSISLLDESESMKCYLFSAVSL